MKANNIFLTETGNKIREARKSKKMTLQTLFELTGIARDNLSRIEAGKKNFHILTLKSIADVLEIDIKYFLA